LARQVKWTEQARDDLDAAAEYISRDSAAYAASFVSRVLETANSLSEFPHKGRFVPEIKSEVIREVPVFDYRLVYTTERSDEVFVLDLIHGARHLPSVWTNERNTEE